MGWPTQGPTMSGPALGLRPPDSGTSQELRPLISRIRGQPSPPCTPASGHAGLHLRVQAMGWPGRKGPSCTRHTSAPRASQSSTSHGYRAASTLPLASS